MVTNIVEYKFMREFKKKLMAVLHTAPIFVEDIRIGYDRVEMMNSETKEIIELPFSDLIPATENVKNIKSWLFNNWYPYLEEEVEVETELNTEEVLRRSRAGEKTEDLLVEINRSIETQRWTVERTTNKNCLVLVSTLDTAKQEIYRLKVPVISFLRRLIRKELSPLDGWFELKDEKIAELMFEYTRKGDSGATVPRNPD